MGAKQTVACPGPHPGMDLFIQSLAKAESPTLESHGLGVGVGATHQGVKGSRLVESVSV